MLVEHAGRLNVRNPTDATLSYIFVAVRYKTHQLTSIGPGELRALGASGTSPDAPRWVHMLTSYCREDTGAAQSNHYLLAYERPAATNEITVQPAVDVDDHHLHVVVGPLVHGEDS